MRVLFVVVLVTLTSCKKPSAPPVVDAGAPVARALPSAPSTLSLLEPVGDTCEWRTRAPSGTTTTLATLPGIQSSRSMIIGTNFAIAWGGSTLPSACAAHSETIGLRSFRNGTSSSNMRGSRRWPSATMAMARSW